MAYSVREDSPEYIIQHKGIDKVKTIELISSVFGSCHDTKITKLSTAILDYCEGNLALLGSITREELLRLGITSKRIERLLSAIELGKRISSYAEEDRPLMNGPEDIIRLLANDFKYNTTEVFMVLLLNTKNRLIKKETMTQGTTEMSPVEPKEIFRVAILNNASSIVLAHGHPSGEVAPSSKDLQITKNIIEIGKLMRIDVLDHIIFGSRTGKWLSMKQKHLI